MELKEQTNYQLYKITRQSPVSINASLIASAKKELSDLKLSEVELDALTVRFESEYPSKMEVEKKNMDKIFGCLMLTLGALLSIFIYVMPIGVFLFLVGVKSILDSNITKKMAYIVISIPVLLIGVFYLFSLTSL